MFWTSCAQFIKRTIWIVRDICLHLKFWFLCISSEPRIKSFALIDFFLSVTRNVKYEVKFWIIVSGPQYEIVSSELNGYFFRMLPVWGCYWCLRSTVLKFCPWFRILDLKFWAVTYKRLNYMLLTIFFSIYSSCSLS